MRLLRSAETILKSWIAIAYEQLLSPYLDIVAGRTSAHPSVDKYRYLDKTSGHSQL